MGDQPGYNWIVWIGIGIVVDGRTACRLSLDNDTAWISTETVNIISDPFNGLPLVQKPNILVFAWGSGETEDVHAIVNGYENNVFLICNVLTIVERGIGIAQGEASSMDPHQHWLRLACLRSRPDIQRQTVLALRGTNPTSEVFDDVVFGGTLARELRGRKRDVRAVEAPG